MLCRRQKNINPKQNPQHTRHEACNGAGGLGDSRKRKGAHNQLTDKLPRFYHGSATSVSGQPWP